MLGGVRLLIRNSCCLSLALKSWLVSDRYKIEVLTRAKVQLLCMPVQGIYQPEGFATRADMSVH